MYSAPSEAEALAKRQREKFEACSRLDEASLAEIGHPGGIAFLDARSGWPFGRACRGVMTWPRVYEALLALCSCLDPDKFETLPEDEGFNGAKGVAPRFVRKGDRRRLSVPSEWLGRDQDVRADLRCGCRSAFLDAKGLPRRLLVYFGIDAHDVRIWDAWWENLPPPQM